MIWKETTNKVKIEGESSMEFKIGRGVRQGDVMSTLLFKVTLE